MKKNEALIELENMIGSKVIEYGENDIKDFASTTEDLIQWSKECDEGVILMTDFDINDCNIYFYGGSIDGDDVSAYIITCNENVVSYGYTLD